MSNPFDDANRHQVWWIVGGVVAVVSLLAVGNGLDVEPVTAEDHEPSAHEASAFERGRQVGRAEMRDTVRDAYVQGQRDALQAALQDEAPAQCAVQCDALLVGAPARLRQRVCGGGS